MLFNNYCSLCNLNVNTQFLNDIYSIKLNYYELTYNLHNICRGKSPITDP